MILFFLLFSSTAQAASCCGGGAGIPTLITGDFSSQVGVSYSYNQTIASAQSLGDYVFFKNRSESTQTLSITGAFLLSEDFQASLAIPVTSRSVNSGVQSEAFTSLGDLKAGMGYEFLTLYEYSAWKPKGIAFFEVSLPTGRSLYQSTMATRADVTGKGVTALRLGGILLKDWTLWDLSLSGFGRYQFVGNFDSQTVHAPLGFGGSLQGGWSPGGGNFRIGAGISVDYQEAPTIRYSDQTQVKGIAHLLWTATAELSYRITPTSSVTLSYNDQTLLGPASNTGIDRGVLLSFQQRWFR